MTILIDPMKEGLIERQVIVLGVLVIKIWENPQKKYCRVSIFDKAMEPLYNSLQVPIVNDRFPIAISDQHIIKIALGPRYYTEDDIPYCKGYTIELDPTPLTNNKTALSKIRPSVTRDHDTRSWEPLCDHDFEYTGEAAWSDKVLGLIEQQRLCSKCNKESWVEYTLNNKE